MPATLGSVNVYLIVGPKGRALVDTGLDDRASREELARLLQQYGMTFGDIDVVVCTHHHVDHAGLGRTFQKAGAEVKMSKKDAELLTAFFSHPERDVETASFSGRHELPKELTAHIKTMFPFLRKLAEPFVPEVGLEEGERLELGGIPFEVLRTPGHTPGHISLWQKASLNKSPSKLIPAVI